MKRGAFVFFILYASVLLAAPRDWKNAKVANITSQSGGAVAVPIGTMVVGVPITKTFYWIETDDTTYVLGPVNKNQLLNITLYGKTKIALDGRNAHILDDDGKDKKLPIAQKIARAPVETPNK